MHRERRELCTMRVGRGMSIYTYEYDYRAPQPSADPPRPTALNG